MSTAAKMVMAQALELSVEDRASVAEQLLLSLACPDPICSTEWAAEAEARITAHERGEISARSIQEALGKYKRG